MKLTKFFAATALVVGCASAMATPKIQFLIDGDTFSNSFRITNLSTINTERITSFSLTLPTGFEFDTVSSTGNQGAYSFGSNTPTLAAGSSEPTDSGNFLRFDFGNSFTRNNCPTGVTAPCVFSWVVDVDAVGATQEFQVFGSSLRGAAVSATFSDGSSARGVLGACPTSLCFDNSRTAYWEATGTLPPPNQTPEPGSLALAGLALLAAGALRAKKV